MIDPKINRNHTPETIGWKHLLPVWLFIGIFLISGSHSQAQELSNLRNGKIFLSQDSTRIDTLSIVETSFSLTDRNGDAIPDSLYHLDPVKSILVWRGTALSDSLTYSYRTFPIDFSEERSLRSTEMIQPEEEYFIAPTTYQSTAVSPIMFESTRLNKTGSISRGVGFGNNQDLTVNSTLSLQMNGQLTDKVNILASITDDNIPIQPEGNTAQLQEFDQVYIQLYDDKSRLTAGDFILRKPRGYFTNYFKRAQGASFQTQLPMGKENQLTFFTETSAAVSKGKFARNIIQGQEGNQGPYRLTGNEDEFFIVILAGTERVFIDGRELKRGQENDYVIDYNTAEITFTAKQLINKDKRIGVEFQYSDANYVRTLAQTSTGIESEKFSAYINFYSEQDAKNQPLQQDLSDDDKRILDAVGDNIELAVAPSFSVEEEYSNDIILYALTDTLGYDSVFVRITEPTETMYTVNFSEVGQGQGDYIQEGFDATGRIFVWVAPDTVNNVIVRNGDYAPIRRLVSPKRNQVLMAGGTYKFSERTQASLEAGFSNQDVNTFSSKGNDDNLSHALRADLEHRQPLGKGENAPELGLTGAIESIGDNFQPIEPYRSVEFNRNWNIDDSLNFKAQNIFTGGLSLSNKAKYRVNYLFDRYDISDFYTGTRNSLSGNVNLRGFDAQFIGSITETDGVSKTRFSRHKMKIEKTLWITKFGFEDEQETNRRYDTDTDSLSINAYKFYDWKAYLTNKDSAKIGYEIFYRERVDYGSELNGYSESTAAKHYGAEIRFTQNPRNQITANISNRELRIVNDELTDQAPESTLLGRLDHVMRLAKNSITSNIYYEIGSGLERRQEYVYISDPTGQGSYTWIDYNDDGIKDLNEFELARPEDGDRYIRVFTPTNTYERAYSNQFSQSIQINPGVLWSREEGIKRLLARFSNQTAFRVQRKTRQEDGANRFNPFIESVGDSILISQSSSIRNTVFFNRSSSKFGLDFTYSNQFSKSPLTTGFEERKNRSHLFRVRYNFTAKYGLVFEQELGTRESLSDVISGRNYFLDIIQTKPTFSYQPNTAFRLSLSGTYTNKQNTEQFGGETAELYDFGLETRFSKVEAGTMFAQINYISISYDGAANNSLTYEMLDGLQNGENITWGAGVQRNIGRNLQLSLSYNGRKSEEIKAIHTGSVQVRAFF